MSWQTVSQIATALGAIFAAGTLASAYILYRRSNRRDYAKQVASDMVQIRTRFDQMSELVKDYGFSDEIAASVVNNSRFDNMFQQLYAAINSEPDYKNRLDGHFSSRTIITVSVHSPLVEQYESWIKELAFFAARYEADFRGLFRVLWSVHYLFKRVLSNLEQVARDEERWTRVLLGMEGGQYDDCSGFKAEFTHQMWKEVYDPRVRRQADIEDLSKVLQITIKGYDRLAPQKLLCQQSREKSIAMDPNPLANANYLTDLLVEAQMALRHILEEKELLAYQELVSRFDARNSVGS